MRLSITDVLFLLPLVVEAVSATSGTFAVPINKKRHHVRAIQKRAGDLVDVTLINPVHLAKLSYYLLYKIADRVTIYILAQT